MRSKLLGSGGSNGGPVDGGRGRAEEGVLADDGWIDELAKQGFLVDTALPS